MDRPLNSLFAVFCLVALGLVQPFAQSAVPAGTTIVKKLNNLLASYCARQPALELAGDGTVVRKDADGSMYRFAFSAIDAVDIDRDSEAHVLLKCKGGNPCIERMDASKTSMSLVAFSIYPLERGDEVATLFKHLRASVAADPKK
jgi:hypothetical protein